MTLIEDFDWTPVSTDATSNEIYLKWSIDTAIDDKLIGYKFFRCKPKIVIVVNGFSFYYGKLVIAADLNPGRDGSDSVTDFNYTHVNDIPSALMAPHISVDPSLSQTYEMSLPFYSATEWYNRWVATSDNPSIYLKYVIVNPLSSANDIAPTSVNIRVYAKMEDVELSTPGILSTESGEPTELKPDGILSAPLSALNSIGTKAASLGFDRVPHIGRFLGPFNTITGVGASMLSKMGYNSPVALDPDPMLLRTNTVNSTTNGRDGSLLLSNDIKQSVAIDSNSATLGSEDEMILHNLVRKWGFLETLTWTTSGLDVEIPVQPNACYFSGSYYRPSPLAFVSATASAWTGSIEFMFEIVCSTFHRGTLGISWVPYGGVQPPNSQNFVNRFKTAIIDISQTRSFVFQVPFGADAPNLLIGEFFNNFLTNHVNGRLHVYEVNPIKSAGSTSSIQINVYIRAGNDFKLYRPTTNLINNYDLIVESTEPEELNNDYDNVQVSNNLLSDRSLVYYGEEMRTVKDIIAKATPVYAGNYNFTPDGAGLHPIVLPYKPTVRSVGMVRTTWGWSLYGYFSTAFLAMRGGLRVKFIEFNATNAATSSVRDPTQTFSLFSYRPLKASTAAYALSSQLYYNSGAQVFSPNALFPNEGLCMNSRFSNMTGEVQIPYINTHRFYNPRHCMSAAVPASYTRVHDDTEIPVLYISSNQKTATPYMFLEHCADDASLHGFYITPKLTLHV